MSTTLLLPVPRELTYKGGDLNLSSLDGSIALKQDPAASLLFIGLRARNALRQFADLEWSIAGGDLPASLAISVDATAAIAEGYRLGIHAQGIVIVGGDLAGAFYGVCTLSQLLQIHGVALPLLEIIDYPDFAARGVMLDISRDKVPTMGTLYALVDMLASWKINQVQLYTEHTFAYRNHRAVWENASPMTAEEILALDAYCRERYIDLVPNQNSIGHMHRWFMHKQYLPLAETEVGLTTPWGTKQDYPFSLSPAVPETLPFLEALYDELLPNFTSRMFNIGGDEAFDLGEGRSHALAAAKGKGRLYLDYLVEIYQRVKARGRTMQFWGDIINRHPDLVPLLPKDIIALEWGYEATHDFPGKSALFAASGVPFYVCPGTSSWTSIGGRTDNAIGNIRNAVENGLKNGAIGVLNTDWGDLGHWQPLPVSYLGFAYGAALNWAYKQNRDIDLPAVLSAFAFRDRAGVMGRVAYDLGNAYQQPGITLDNGSVLFWSFLRPLDAMRDVGSPRMHPEGYEVAKDDAKMAQNLHSTVDYIDEILTPLEHARMALPDAELIKREFVTAARMLKHGARRALWQLEGKDTSRESLLADLAEIESELQRNWLARNRPGGLSDSMARLRRAHQMYAV